MGIETLLLSNSKNYMRERSGNERVRLGGVTAVTMKNVVFWDIKTHFIPHRRHITSQIQRPAG
jgi:hypothetical protein